ncbi:hypothetical protein L208DRAFT_1409145 [Tricholoma matsutake]|nr:hypothetical protein L208DRAFT_1409145 [Tricholoma matsutake 945]
MTAILLAGDVLRRDRHISLDDNQINYSTSSIDWRAKYNEVADMLAETRAELDDFHHASKELEAELENELQRTEKAQMDLKVKAFRAEEERDEWKSKFMSLQTNHNTTTASLQRELDKLRQEHQHTKIQLRDLEMGNDDLERNERAVSSSLADMESKYSRALEEKILLEHELLEKANLEEGSQRLRDELRDANVEISILKDQLAAISNTSAPSETTSSHVPLHATRIAIPSDDDLLNTPPPPDLQLCDLSPSTENLPSVNTTPKASNSGAQSALLQRAGFRPHKSHLTTPVASSGVTRSNTLPSIYSPSTSTPRTPALRPPTVRQPSQMSTTSTTSTISKNKGVQMVSEMRARVRNLEQKIHTRVPRLRIGSMTTRLNANSPAPFAITNTSATSSSSSIKSSIYSNRRSNDSRGSDEVEPKNKKNAGGESSGWVLIMEDSPSPPKDKEKERRRLSSPSAPTAFRPGVSTSIPAPALGLIKPNNLNQSTMNAGIRRPQSRLSAGSLSTTTTSSIPTPVSRPATPTYLPVPTSSLYSYPATAGLTGIKRSTGPNGSNKRSSLGSNAIGIPLSDSQEPRTTIPPPRPPSDTPAASFRYNFESSKALPQLPGVYSNITMRPASKLPSGTTSMLAQSRIGRPSSGGFSGRKSNDNKALDVKPDSRPRSGSSASTYEANRF